MLRLALLLSLCIGLPCAIADPVRLILVGDSTIATRTGYGDALCARFRSEVSCINLAKGGRSSGSFRAEGRWDEVQALLKDGKPYAKTYVLIQFGHNDQPGKQGRSTDLVTEYPANMARYVAEARSWGALPVLVTPLTRRSFRGAWLHDDLAPWTAATRRVAAHTRADLLDLNALSAAAVQAMGSAEADTLAEEPAPPPGAIEVEGAPKSRFDRTHVGAKGAALFSDMVARELVRLRPELAAWLRQP